MPAARLATRLMGQPVTQVAPMLLRRYGGDNPASHAWGNRFPSWPTLANLGSNGRRGQHSRSAFPKNRPTSPCWLEEKLSTRKVPPTASDGDPHWIGPSLYRISRRHFPAPAQAIAPQPNYPVAQPKPGGHEGSACRWDGRHRSGCDAGGQGPPAGRGTAGGKPSSVPLGPPALRASPPGAMAIHLRWRFPASSSDPPECRRASSPWM